MWFNFNKFIFPNLSSTQVKFISSILPSFFLSLSLCSSLLSLLVMNSLFSLFLFHIVNVLIHSFLEFLTWVFIISHFLPNFRVPIICLLLLGNGFGFLKLLYMKDAVFTVKFTVLGSFLFKDVCFGILVFVVCVICESWTEIFCV